MSIKYAENKLKQIGVNLISNGTIEEIQENKVLLKQNGQSLEIQGNIIIWSAGVKGTCHHIYQILSP